MTYSESLFTISTGAAHFDDGPHIGKACACCGFADIARQCVIVQMRCRAAHVADQEDAIVQAPRMRIGDIGVGAFHAARKVGGDEQVKDAVNAVGGNALSPLLRDQIGNVIGRGGFDESGEHVKDIRTHIGPLFARLDKRGLCGAGQRFACVVVMMM
jgi:hypothetical protein